MSALRKQKPTIWIFTHSPLLNVTRSHVQSPGRPKQHMAIALYMLIRHFYPAQVPLLVNLLPVISCFKVTIKENRCQPAPSRCVRLENPPPIKFSISGDAKQDSRKNVMCPFNLPLPLVVVASSTSAHTLRPARAMLSGQHWLLHLITSY